MEPVYSQSFEITDLHVDCFGRMLPSKILFLMQEVAGTLRGNELATPLGLPAKTMCNSRKRYVNFTDLDRNGHMNNTRYLDWIYDLLPGQFHREHSIREFTLCYLNEALEGQQLTLSWDFPEEGCLQMDAHRLLEGKDERIFGAKILFD